MSSRSLAIIAVVTGAALLAVGGSLLPPAEAQLSAGTVCSGRVELVSDRTQAVFDAEKGCLVSLSDSFTGREYLVHEAGPLFRLTLLSDKREATKIPSTDASQVSVTRLYDGSLLMDFSEFRNAELAVHCRVRASADGSLRWRISVENDTELAITRVEYPLLPAPLCLGETSEDDCLLLSICDGNLLEQPEVNWTPDTPEWHTWSPYPGVLSMQLTYYYDTYGGLYVATYDSAGHPKWLGARRRGEAADLTPEHEAPERPGADYETMYDVVTAAMAGGWQAAAVRYREWAHQQHWCKRSVAERSDIPPWLKEGNAFYVVSVRQENVQYSTGCRYPAIDFVPDVAKNVQAWSNALQTPLVALLMNWEKQGPWVCPDYFPPAGGEQGFREACDEIAQNGNRVMVFISGMRWTLGYTVDHGDAPPEARGDYAPVDNREKFAQIAERHAVVKEDGSVMVRGAPPSHLGSNARVCFATPLAYDMLYEPVDKLLALGVTGVQADGIVGGGGYACYETSHGHPPGRGAWQAPCLRAMYDDVRQNAKLTNPDFVWSQEQSGEYFAQSVDLFHMRNHLEHRWPRSGRAIRGVPLFTFVYHRYVPAFGGDAASARDSRDHAVNFVTGQFPAVSVWCRARGPEEVDNGVLTLLRDTIKLHRGAGRRYLVLGEMLPSGSIQSPQVSRDYGDYSIAFPVVTHALWSSPEGDYAYALANWSDQEVTIALPLQHDLPDMKQPRAIIHRGDGSTTELAAAETLEVRLPAASAALVELQER